MSKSDIPQEVVDLNSMWIDSLEFCLAERGNQELTNVVMKAAGRKCAVQILEDCRQILGKIPESIDELLDAMNQRRLQKHNLASLWDKKVNHATLILEECGCSLVRAGLARPNPVHCLCSKGLMESLFSEVCRGRVRVELARAIGNGDDVCEFNVMFDE